MNKNLCSTHFLPINQICGLNPCSFIMCSICFLDHQKQTHHTLAVQLNQSTLNFFGNFLSFIVNKLQMFITNVMNFGFNGIFKTNLAVQNYWDSKNINAQIVKHTLQILTNYKNLMQNNRKFVMQNRYKYSNLFHIQFFKDIYNLVINKWSVNSQRLIEQLQEILKTKYPNRYLGAGILKEIQDKRVQLMLQGGQKIVEQLKEPSKLSDLKISKVESVIQQKCGFQQQQKQIKFTKTIDSFYEILDSSQINIQFPQQSNPILIQIPQSSISANFLTYQQLQKQVQQLLIENQKLKQMNNDLQNENTSLKGQNDKLKYNRVRK